MLNASRRAYPEGSRERSQPFLSVVVPLYNERDCVEPLVATLREVLGEVTTRWEIVLVDDHSDDDTAARIRRLALEDSRIRGARLAERQGQHTALACGLDLAYGDAVITMDADLQHPPARIPDMVRAWQAGYEVVDMVKARDSRGFASRADALAASLFYGLYNLVASCKVTPGTSEFRLLDRRWVEALRRRPERFDYPKGVIPQLGARRIQLEFVCPQRELGRTGYTFGRRLTVALQALALFASGRVTGLLCALLALLLVALAGAVLRGGAWGGGADGRGRWLLGLAAICGFLLVAIGALGLVARRRRHRHRLRQPYCIEATLGGERPDAPPAAAGAAPAVSALPAATVVRP